MTSVKFNSAKLIRELQGATNGITCSRTLASRVILFMFPALDASQSHVSRFRGAPYMEVPRIMPRASNTKTGTFSSALMDSLLWASMDSHIEHAYILKHGYTSRVKKTEKALESNNVATDRSIAIHATFMERMVQNNNPYLVQATQYNYAVLAGPNAKVWTLPVWWMASVLNEKLQAERMFYNATESLAALNGDLIASVPFEVGSALVSPSIWALINQGMCSYHVWSGMASVVWVLRASLQRSELHPTTTVDKIGQNVSLALWTPTILGIPVRSPAALAACGSIADLCMMFILSNPNMDRALSGSVVFFMLMQLMRIVPDRAAYWVKSHRSMAEMIDMYRPQRAITEIENLERTKPWTLETRLLHSLWLADAIQSSGSSSAESNSSQSKSSNFLFTAVNSGDKSAPFTKIWSLPAPDEDKDKVYAASDAFIAPGGVQFGYTAAAESLDQIAARHPWLADDELALDAVVKGLRSGKPTGTILEELLLERALTALSASVVASKDESGLVAASLRLDMTGASGRATMTPESSIGMENVNHLYYKGGLVPIFGNTSVREWQAEASESPQSSSDPLKSKAKIAEGLKQKRKKVHELLKQQLQTPTKGLWKILHAVDVIVGALKPLKNDVAPLHYHAGVVWYNAARAMEHESELCTTTLEEYLQLDRPRECDYSQKFAARWEDAASEIRRLFAECRSIEKPDSLQFDQAMQRQMQSGLLACHMEAKRLGLPIAELEERVALTLGRKTDHSTSKVLKSDVEVLGVQSTKDATPHSTTWDEGSSPPLDTIDKEASEVIRRKFKLMDLGRKLFRERLRVNFLQQARRHFQAAQQTCRLKHVEMRGRISKSLGYTLVELEQDPVQILQALLRASRCLPRDVTLLEDMQQVWHTTDCQASLSELEKREPERHAVLSEETASAFAILQGLGTGPRQQQRQ